MIRVAECVSLVKRKLGSLVSRVDDDSIRAAISESVRQYSRFNPIFTNMVLHSKVNQQVYAGPDDLYLMMGVNVRGASMLPDYYTMLGNPGNTLGGFGSALGGLDGVLEEFEINNPAVMMAGDLIVAFWYDRLSTKVVQIGSNILMHPTPQCEQDMVIPYYAYHLSDTDDYNTMTKYDTVPYSDVDEVCEYAQGRILDTLAASMMATGLVEAAGSFKQDVSRTVEHLKNIAAEHMKCYNNRYFPQGAVWS